MRILYHPNKSNIVVDALSKLSIESTVHINEESKELVKEVHRLTRLGVHLVDSGEGVVVWKGAE